MTKGEKDFSTGCGKAIAGFLLLAINLIPTGVIYYAVKQQMLEFGAADDIYSTTHSIIIALGIMILWCVMDLKVEHNFLEGKVEKLLEE